MEHWTPPQTPPAENDRDVLDHSALATIISTSDSSTLVRARCDSDQTLFDFGGRGQGQGQGHDEGEGEGEGEVVTIELCTNRLPSHGGLKRAIECALKRGPGSRPGPDDEGDHAQIARLEQELDLVRRQLKRAQQSIRDLRLNKGKLERKLGEQVAIAHQAELDLDKVLSVFNLDDDARGGGRGRGGGGYECACGRRRKRSASSSWAVVFALLVWVVVAKCC